MQNINNIAELKAAMYHLEAKQAKEWVLINEHISIVREKLQPMNLIKKGFSDLFYSPEVKETVVGTVAGIAAGTLSRALIIGATHNPVKMLLGAILQMKVSNTVAKNSDTLGYAAAYLFRLFSRKKKENFPAGPAQHSDIF